MQGLLQRVRRLGAPRGCFLGGWFGRNRFSPGVLWLDRLGELDLARRKIDPMDRRSILVQRTLKGTAFLRDLRSVMAEASTMARRTGQQSGRGAGCPAPPPWRQHFSR